MVSEVIEDTGKSENSIHVGDFSRLIEIVARVGITDRVIPRADTLVAGRAYADVDIRGGSLYDIHCTQATLIMIPPLTLHK